LNAEKQKNDEKRRKYLTELYFFEKNVYNIDIYVKCKRGGSG
jgi:hypothetical protein